MSLFPALLSATTQSQQVTELTMKQEVILLLVGGFIALISSVVILLVKNIIDRHGKLKLYKKIVYSKAFKGETWGFRDNGTFFHVPLWIEIHNTTNTPQVIRDLNIWLYNNNKKICSMIQINKAEKEVLANDGAYSFVIEPRSIKKYDCYFTLKKSDLPEDTYFDELKLGYYNYKDKFRLYHLKTIDSSDCWTHKRQEADKDWTVLK